VLLRNMILGMNLYYLSLIGLCVGSSTSTRWWILVIAISTAAVLLALTLPATKVDGVLTITRQDENMVYLLGLDSNPYEFPGRLFVTFKVVVSEEPKQFQKTNDYISTTTQVQPVKFSYRRIQGM
jgi:hypothetical protein